MLRKLLLQLLVLLLEQKLQKLLLQLLERMLELLLQMLELLQLQKQMQMLELLLSYRKQPKLLPTRKRAKVIFSCFYFQ